MPPTALIAIAAIPMTPIVGTTSATTGQMPGAARRCEGREEFLRRDVGDYRDSDRRHHGPRAGDGEGIVGGNDRELVESDAGMVRQRGWYDRDEVVRDHPRRCGDDRCDRQTSVSRAA
jgi:hypothetical protein